jgi:serine/threonine-protein kinase
MELIEGHTLNRHECDFMTHPAEAARIMATVARAVHHAHQRRIIHRDLKPGNILIDSGGDPHITDFGLAMRETGGERLTDSDVLIGTLPYMSPEQLSDKVQPLTTSVDIWSLGVILYELLTRRLPFQGRTQVATLENIRKVDPVRPRTLNRQLPRDLEAICLKCLEKEPERRYGSALGLARDLERWLKREPIEARPVHRVVRAWSWCRRNPAAAGLILGSALLLVAASLGVMIRIAQKQERDRQKLEGLIHMARFASNSILNRMQEWGVRVEALAHSPDLIGRLAEWRRTLKDHPSADPENLRSRPEAQKLQSFLDTLPREPMIVNWQVMDVDGIMMARKPASILGVNFRERDYLQGTLRHAGQSGPAAIHISSVYRSQVDGLDKFDICAPVADGGTVLGILAVSITTDPTLGVPYMHGEQRKVVLVAPWDPSPPRERRPEGATPEYVVLLHPAMTSGHEAVPFDKEMMPARFPRNCREELSVTDTFPISELSKERYLDPFGSRNPQYSGPWLAGFAPVGNTGFVVIVQQKAD